MQCLVDAHMPHFTHPHSRFLSLCLLLILPMTVSRASVRQMKPGGVVVVIAPPLLSPPRDGAGRGLNTSKSFNNAKRNKPTKASKTKPTVLKRREGIFGRALGWVPVRVCVEGRKEEGGREEVKRMKNWIDGDDEERGLELSADAAATGGTTAAVVVLCACCGAVGVV